MNRGQRRGEGRSSRSDDMRSGTLAVPERRRRPRVVLVSHVFWPDVGGAEVNHAQVSAELARDCEVVVLTAQRRPTPDPQPPDGTYRVERLPARRVFGENLLGPLRLFRRLRALRPDIVWGNHPSLSADLAGWYARISGSRWAVTYHADLSPGRWYARPYTWWEGVLLRRADVVLVNAPNYVDRLARRGVDRSRVHAVTPGPGIGGGDPPSVSAGVEPPGDRPGPEHPFLFVGGLDRAREYKRPGRLIEAIARLRDEGLRIHLWMVGDGDRRASLERMAADLGLQGQVRFFGFLDDPALAARYYGAWALVLPSTSTEGFGLVTLEAVHYGCPVITTDSVAAGEVLARAGCARAYPESDPFGLERELRRLWEAPAERRAMARAARAAAGRFSWARSAPELARPILALAGIAEPLPSVPHAVEGRGVSTDPDGR